MTNKIRPINDTEESKESTPAKPTTSCLGTWATAQDTKYAFITCNNNNNSSKSSCAPCQRLVKNF